MGRNEHRDKSFAYIEEEAERAPLAAEGADDVGGSNVAGADAPQVDSMQAGDQQTKRNRTEQISTNNQNQPFHCVLFLRVRICL